MSVKWHSITSRGKNAISTCNFYLKSSRSIQIIMKRRKIFGKLKTSFAILKNISVKNNFISRVFKKLTHTHTTECDKKFTLFLMNVKIIMDINGVKMPSSINYGVILKHHSVNMIRECE